MAKFLIMVLLLLLPLLGSRAEKQVYIVYFGEHSGEKALHEIEETHHSYLVSVKSTEEEARASLLYSYKHSINGFAAVLSPDEVSKLSEMEDVMSVFRSGEYTIHTTRSWEFVGLLMQEEEHTIPTHFKKLGSDLLSRAKKIIGARYFIKEFEHHYGPLNASEDYRSSRDKNGHGTHTASTVGGRMVHNVSVNGGFGRGIASGGAPLVRLAIYKVCWQFNGKSLSCSGADIMAAIDAAVADGVHVMSISLGTRGQRHEKYYTDDIFVIGALHASRNNIVVACSAGNDGPTPSTVSHIAPWIITVAASSVDRKFVSPVVLGNGSKIKGQSATPSKLEKKMYPLVYAADVADQDVSKDYAVQCLPHSLSLDKVKGKIVLCMIEYTSVHGEDMEVKRAGGAGYILGSSRAGGVDELAAHANVLPATVVVYTDAIRILEYINSTKNPIATIIPAKTVLHTKPAPFMAAFSTSVINNNGLPLTNDRGNVATPFAYGSGHFQPTKAADPGLVYDASYYDYLLYLCSLGSVKKFDKTFKCPKAPPSSFNLNYPSLAVSKLNGTVSVKRTVTNVGGGGKSIYFFTSQPPVGMSVRAHPSILVFDRVGQKKSFTITLRAISDEILRKKDGYGFGWYKWTDAHALHVVRSPIAVSLA
ncbi:hypothetical protein FEM48_Zijuj01G0055200 [Ziziphus jujuba var. spinosa]|uniref:Subtilisin-like protease SBT5.6 n=1 Tax=Ziziphus jujuba var. spinosa TaxID=714518 RepID=A0A978VZE5_ZIZJJ|nr:hypothetical protein FEM48_Zijuj01G0055200 [Ziziphus jujuba var. spinosa]